jgi:hypothetical protein
MSGAAATRPARGDSASAAPEAANDNRGSGNPTIVDLPGEIPEDRRRRFAEVLARILVARTLIALGIQPAIDE